MIVLHAHWQPPRSPADDGGVVLWAETAGGPQPRKQRGRLAAKPRPKRHPFCLDSADLRAHEIMADRLPPPAAECEITLTLPATRSGPQPSPGLWHDWDLDAKTPPFLAPWHVTGVRLPPADAVELLVGLPAAVDLPPAVRYGADVGYWRTTSNLVLEALAAQKLAPVLAMAPDAVHARWLPVLDSSKDAARLARLERGMPPACRSESHTDAEPPSPRRLLDTFVNMAGDALARRWGRDAAAGTVDGDDPVGRWLAALFSADPTVDASLAQLDALAHSHRAWIRNLYAAGDAAFRVGFRLEAPLQQGEGSEAADWRLHYLLQARDDPSLLVPAGAVWRTRGRVLRKVGRRLEQPQEKLLAGLGYAGRLFAPITGSLTTARPERLALDTGQAYAFLREAAPLLEGAGFAVLVPPWWNRPGSRLGVRLRLRPSKGQGQGADAIPTSGLTFDNLVRFKWDVSLGDEVLSREEFEALVALKAPLVQIRGQWVQLDPEQIESAIRFWEAQAIEGEMGLHEALRLGLGAEATEDGLPIEGVETEGWLGAWLERFTRHEKMTELAPPEGLLATLRPYQRFGYSWLEFLKRWGLGACLADDMGLGKTIQTIALLLFEQEQGGCLPGPTLLVCPTSVVTNWEREIARFAPSLTSLAHQGPGRLRDDELVRAAQGVGMVLTSYALARRDIDTLRQVAWFGVVLDEAQNIKNPSAKQTQAIRSIDAGFRIALTGTPVENRLSELWSIMQFLNPGYLGSRQVFRREFALPIERYGDEDSTRRLKSLVGPFILRRVKSDPSVIQDLPDKVETKVYSRLTEEQATLYQAVVADAMAQVEESDGIQRKGLVLSMLMQLKQICNHPVQYLHQAEAGDADTGALAERSGKLQRLVEMLEEMLSAGDSALVFTQFAEMGLLLHDYLPTAVGAGTLYLHGGVPAKKRDGLVQRFQDEDGPPLFILSLKAGGTGLNLTRANHVFHFDRWWNPAVEDQATDRAYRIGQKRNVQVHKFVSVGTVEEKIDDMIEHKKALAEAVVGSGEGWLTEISSDELHEMVQLRA